MAFVTAKRGGTFEAREAYATPEGPRSRTLATFRELDAASIEKIVSRAEKAPPIDELIRSTLRAGGTIAAKPVDESARETLRLIARGERPNGKLARLLREALTDGVPSAAQWLGTTPAERGEALRDLLLLTDAIPLRRRPRRIGFPRIDSTSR